MGNIRVCGPVGPILWQDRTTEPAVGKTLMWPLKTCVHTVRQLPQTRLLCVIWAVVKVALVLVALVPSLILAAAGMPICRIFHTVERANAPAINWDNISEAPQNVPFKRADEYGNSGIRVGQIDLMAKASRIRELYGVDLIEQFKGVLTKAAPEYLEGKRDDALRDARYSQIIMQEAKLYIQNIFDSFPEIDHVRFSQTQQFQTLRAAVDNLQTKLQNCDPTWGNGARDTFLNVCGANTPKERLLRYAQEAKELILNAHVEYAGPINLENPRETPQWHTLNWVRRERQFRWGLTPPITDRYIDNFHDHITLNEIDQGFPVWYNAQQLVAIVHRALIRDFPGIGEFSEAGFSQVLTQATGEDDWDNLKGDYFEAFNAKMRDGSSYEQYQINERGVVVLLRAFGILR